MAFGSASTGCQMLKSKYTFELFADYFQFYLQDDLTGDLPQIWTPEACDRLLAIGPGTIMVGTARNMTVPVTIEHHDEPPDREFDEWDQINECSIEVASGTIVIAGCTDY